MKTTRTQESGYIIQYCFSELHQLQVQQFDDIIRVTRKVTYTPR